MVEEVKSVENLNPCPYPGSCPHGAKPEGYTCPLSFVLNVAEPAPHVKKFCAWVKLQLVAINHAILAGHQAPGIVLAGPGALPAPDGNGRRKR